MDALGDVRNTEEIMPPSTRELATRENREKHP
jgi:hypothetical protein